MAGWHGEGWSVTPGGGGGGGVYVGPLDLAGFTTAFEYHGLRAGSAAYAASLGNLADVTAYNGGGAAVGSVLTIKCLSTGGPDMSGYAAWKTSVDALGATSYRCTKVYGQKGLFNLVVGLTVGPLFVVNDGASGTLPVLNFDGGGASPYLVASATLGTAHSRPWAMSWAAQALGGGVIYWFEKTVSSTGNANADIVDFNPNIRTENDPAGGHHQDVTTSSFVDGTYKSFLMSYNSGSGAGTYHFKVNGTQLDANDLDPTFAGDSALASDCKVAVGAGGGINGGAFAYMSYKLFEIIFIDGIPSFAQHDALVTNQRSFGIVT